MTDNGYLYYDDGQVQIWHGDCRDILPRLSGVDLIVTSPPYNTLGTLPDRGTGFMRGNRWLAKVATHGYADDMTEDEYREWQQTVASLLHAAAKPGAS